mmetsp:Transcript_2331/g.9864  ORF Transcript_2331/g.9864 Transcript_2331/m.9864 type:complete len:208 (+) Transcript_2331:540-1163(+)
MDSSLWCGWITHNPLRFLQSQTTLTRREARHVNTLLPYSFTIKHRTGQSQYRGCAQPRCAMGRISIRLTSNADWGQVYETDAEFSAQFRNPRQFQGFQRKKGLLFLYARLCVPNNHVTEIIDTHHNSVTAGHFAPRATYRLTRSRYYWPTMWQDVYDGYNIDRFEPVWPYVLWHAIRARVTAPTHRTRTSSRLDEGFQHWISKRQWL